MKPRYNQYMRFSPVTFRIYSILLIIVGVAICIYGFVLGKTTKIQIQWTTATEFDTAGFNLYRSDSQSGPFTKINPEIIQASDDPLKGGSYTYYDANVVPGKTYWYQLEDVELTGNTTKHEPIEVVAKQGGLLEGIIGVFTILFGILGLVIDRRSREKNRMDDHTKSTS